MRVSVYAIVIESGFEQEILGMYASYTLARFNLYKYQKDCPPDCKVYIMRAENIQLYKL